MTDPLSDYGRLLREEKKNRELLIALADYHRELMLCGVRANASTMGYPIDGDAILEKAAELHARVQTIIEVKP